MYLSKIQIPINSSVSPRNINSIQNYLKYLHIGLNNKKKVHKIEVKIKN